MLDIYNFSDDVNKAFITVKRKKYILSNNHIEKSHHALMHVERKQNRINHLIKLKQKQFYDLDLEWYNAKCICYFPHIVIKTTNGIKTHCRAHSYNGYTDFDNISSPNLKNKLKRFNSNTEGNLDLDNLICFELYDVEFSKWRFKNFKNFQLEKRPWKTKCKPSYLILTTLFNKPIIIGRRSRYSANAKNMYRLYFPGGIIQNWTIFENKSYKKTNIKTLEKFLNYINPQQNSFNFQIEKILFKNLT